MFLARAPLRRTGGAAFTDGQRPDAQGGRIDNAGPSSRSRELALQLDGTFIPPHPSTAGAFRLVGGSVTGQRPLVWRAGCSTAARSVGLTRYGAASVGGSTAALVPGGEGGIGTPAFRPHAPPRTPSLEVELGGTAPGQFDQVAVGGNAALAGTLRVRYAGAFRPAVGDRFPVVTCTGTCSGAFASARPSARPHGHSRGERGSAPSSW